MNWTWRWSYVPDRCMCFYCVQLRTSEHKWPIDLPSMIYKYKSRSKQTRNSRISFHFNRNTRDNLDWDHLKSFKPFEVVLWNTDCDNTSYKLKRNPKAIEHIWSRPVWVLQREFFRISDDRSATEMVIIRNIKYHFTGYFEHTRSFSDDKKAEKTNIEMIYIQEDPPEYLQSLRVTQFIWYQQVLRSINRRGCKSITQSGMSY